MVTQTEKVFAQLLFANFGNFEKLVHLIFRTGIANTKINLTLMSAIRYLKAFVLIEKWLKIGFQL